MSEIALENIFYNSEKTCNTLILIKRLIWKYICTLLPGIRFVVFINKPCRHLQVTAAFIIGTTFLLKVDLQERKYK